MLSDPKVPRNDVVRRYLLRTIAVWLIFCAGSPLHLQAQAADKASSNLPSAPPVDDYSRFDRLRWKGLSVPLPGPADTLDQGAFGLRDALADLGIGYFAFSGSYFTTNMIDHAGPVNGNQLYSGQRLTYSSSNYAYLTYDLSRHGVPNGQLVVGGAYVSTNWNPLGPNTFSLAEASYYQTLFDGVAELKIGYLQNSMEFLGTFVGNSLAGGIFGPNASIMYEAGESAGAYITPGMNIKINLPGNFYTKIGLQRPISPDGVVTEHNQNPSGVRFSVPNAGFYMIDETGYRKSAAPGAPQTWLRLAGAFNTSAYRSYREPGTRSKGDYALFLLADRQLWQSKPLPGAANQGIYAGFSFMYTPPEINRFSQYYELRLYGVGLIPGRPQDMISLVGTRNVFSHYLVSSAKEDGQLAHSDSLSTTLSYSAHVMHGVNVNVALGYTNNPTGVTYTPETGHALNLTVGTVVFL